MPPVSHRFMTDIDATLMQQIANVPVPCRIIAQRQILWFSVNSWQVEDLAVACLRKAPDQIIPVQTLGN